MRIKVQSDEEIKEEARAKVRDMLLRKSFAERWEPLCKEMGWVVKGRQNEAEHQMILPDYCSSGKELRVVACAAPQMGMTAACATAGKVIERWRPRIIVMCGICA